MNKQTSHTVGRASPSAGLKAVGLGLAAILGLILLVPLGLWFATQPLTARRRRPGAKKTVAERPSGPKVAGS